ncbi:MAG TPA: hypothetical protein PK668_07000 [Myxococcota bacterium]|nr:hypothetical protein [Myxococcota bacterium]HRY92408.1 hypothetical protein [Myxococcota bacterium]HSA22660.1 hypothetical protein [Myxococcota bacterium]
MTRSSRDALLASLTALAALGAAEAALRLSGLGAELRAEDPLESRAGLLAALPFEPEVVVLGNSRARHGLDTGALEASLSPALGRPARAWNHGQGGVTGWSLLSGALRMLERARPPALAVLCLAPADLVEATPPELRHMTWSQGWRPGDLPALLRAGVGVEDALTAFGCSLAEVLRHRARLLSLLGGAPPGSPLPADAQGYKAEAPVPADLQRARALARAEGYRRELVGPGVRLSADKLGCLEEAVRRLRAAGVRVALVMSPASSPVAALNRAPGSVVPGLLAALEALAGRQGVPFWDHTRPPGLTDADFTDGDHLNRDGARRYTTWLAEEFLRPLLQDASPSGPR